MKIIILLALLTQDNSFTDPSATKVWDSGPSNSKYDITFLGEGYTAAEQGRYNDQVQKLADHIVSCVEPYRSWRNALNIHRVNVISVNSGIGGNTAFESTAFSGGCCGGTLVFPNNWNNVLTAAGQTPFDNVIILVNTGIRGGAATFFNGRGYAVVTSSLELTEIMVHEMGHSIGRLADEYGGLNETYPLSVEPNFPNVTIHLNQLKWAEFVGQEGVGTFEGGSYYNYGIWRPTYGNCMMRSLMNHYCPVCRDAIINEIKVFAPNDVATDEPITPHCYFQSKGSSGNLIPCVSSVAAQNKFPWTIILIAMGFAGFMICLFIRRNRNKF